MISLLYNVHYNNSIPKQRQNFCSEQPLIHYDSYAFCQQLVDLGRHFKVYLLDAAVCLIHDFNYLTISIIVIN